MSIRSTQGKLGATGDTVPLLYTMAERFPCSYVSRQLCQQHDAGTATLRTLKQHQVYVRTNATAWVEARWGQHLERSPNVTLHLDEAGECWGPGRAAGCSGHHSCAVPAVKLDPPSHGTSFTKANGRLELRLPRPQCHHKERPPPRREARFRRVGDGSWMQVRGPKRSPNHHVPCTSVSITVTWWLVPPFSLQVMCETGKGEDEDDPGLFCPILRVGVGGQTHPERGHLTTTDLVLCSDLRAGGNRCLRGAAPAQDAALEQPLERLEPIHLHP